MLNFINLSAPSFEVVITTLFIVHIYLVIRFCAGNIITSRNRSDNKKFLDLMTVVFVPIFGYFWILKAKKER